MIGKGIGPAGWLSHGGEFLEMQELARAVGNTVKSFMENMKTEDRLTITETITDNEGKSSQSYPVIVAVIVHRKG